jgi:hypothetical protein
MADASLPFGIKGPGPLIETALTDRHNDLGVSVVHKLGSARRYDTSSARLVAMGLQALAILGAGGRVVPRGTAQQGRQGGDPLRPRPVPMRGRPKRHRMLR